GESTLRLKRMTPPMPSSISRSISRSGDRPGKPTTNRLAHSRKRLMRQPSHGCVTYAAAMRILLASLFALGCTHTPDLHDADGHLPQRFDDADAWALRFEDP